VELYNSGEMARRDEELLHLTLETPWTMWREESGRDQEDSSLGPLNTKGVKVLNCLYLGTRGDQWSRWREAEGLRGRVVWESKNASLEPFGQREPRRIIKPQVLGLRRSNAGGRRLAAPLGRDHQHRQAITAG